MSKLSFSSFSPSPLFVFPKAILWEDGGGKFFYQRFFGGIKDSSSSVLVVRSPSSLFDIGFFFFFFLLLFFFGWFEVFREKLSNDLWGLEERRGPFLNKGAVHHFFSSFIH